MSNHRGTTLLRVKNLHATLRTSYLDKVGKTFDSNEICQISGVKQKTSRATLHATRQAVGSWRESEQTALQGERVLRIKLYLFARNSCPRFSLKMTHFFEIVYLVVAVSLIHTFDSIEGKFGEFCFVFTVSPSDVLVSCDWSKFCVMLCDVGQGGRFLGQSSAPKVLKDTSTDSNLSLFYFRISCPQQ